LFIRLTFQGDGPHGKVKRWSGDLKYENAKFFWKPILTSEEIIWLKKRLVRFLIPEIVECPLL